MRAKTKWTPGGTLLWLIAAVAATFVVCSQPERPEPSAMPDEVEIELELGE